MEPSSETAVQLPCPVCGRWADAIKQYRYLSWCLFLGAGAVWQVGFYRACPECMRRRIWRNCLINVIPANVLWLLLLLPWAVVLTWASYRRGHSRAVVRGVTVEAAVARENAEHEVSWHRVLAVVSLLVFWMPVLGLAVAGLAHGLNRRSPSWTRRASLVAFVSSGVVHAALVVLAVVDSVT